jgi:twitching motility protein PilT
MNLNDLLKLTFEKRASDLHIKVGVPPVLRIDGKLAPLETEKRLTQEDSLAIASGIMTDAQKTKFKEKNELDMALPCRAGSFPRERVQAARERRHGLSGRSR